MSKSGLHAHFGSKQELQLATVAEAARIFDTEVVQPALAAPTGLGQLAAAEEAMTRIRQLLTAARGEANQ